MKYLENKKYSFKTVILTLVLTHLCAIVLTWILLWPGIESFLVVLYAVPAVLFAFPVGLIYYVECVEFSEAWVGWFALIFFYLMYIMLFILALCFRGKKAFISILIIWIALLILNIYGCIKEFGKIDI